MMRRLSLAIAAGLLGLGVLAAPCGACAQAAPKTEAQLDDEARQADELYQHGQTLRSFPMYEELHARRPERGIYTERLAMAYVAHGGASGSKQGERADNEKALHLLQQLKAQGQTSDLSQVMIEKLTSALSTPAAAAPGSGPRAAGGAYEKAEFLFNKGDLAGSVAQYKLAWEQFPQFYPAPLYAGDAEYKMGHPDEAGVWFARAIAIDPDAETAHRYWADCLVKAGKPQDARRQYLLAYVGDPYAKAPGLSLREWARVNHQRFVPPPITLPAPPSKGKNGGINITVDPASLNSSMSSAWLMYSMNAASWQGDKFKKEYPREPVYRHTLAEELDGLKLALDVLREQKTPPEKLDATARSLLALDKDGMLACWLLLDHADNGMAQDYEAYRAAHKSLLLQYVEKYDLHPA